MWITLTCKTLMQTHVILADDTFRLRHLKRRLGSYARRACPRIIISGFDQRVCVHHVPAAAVVRGTRRVNKRDRTHCMPLWLHTGARRQRRFKTSCSSAVTKADRLPGRTDKHLQLRVHRDQQWRDDSACNNTTRNACEYLRHIDRPSNDIATKLSRP